MFDLINRTYPRVRTWNEDLWRDFWYGNDQETEKFHAPAVDIDEKETHFELKMDLPGIKKENIEIAYNKGTLTISGSRKEEKESKDEACCYKRERFSGSFKRTFQVGDTIDSEGISANLADGVLTINLPKKPDQAVRQIPLN